MIYWLDLFTGQTWQEFQDHGAKVSGFRARMHNAVERMKPGDILLCYLTGVMRWVGALEVQGRSDDNSVIWEFDEFPERLTVKPILLLPRNTVCRWRSWKVRSTFIALLPTGPDTNGFLRMSPNRFKRETDAQLIIASRCITTAQEAAGRPKEARTEALL